MLTNLFKSNKPKEIVTEPAILEIETTAPATTVDFKSLYSEEYLTSAPEIVGWVSTQEQEMLFSALLLFYSPTQTLLDVGCGRADLYGYLQNLYKQEIPYSGIDRNPNMIQVANMKYPGADVAFADILDLTPGTDSKDWVMASGLFNLNDHPDMISYAKQCIDKMYELANAGVAFNLLTGLPPDMSAEDEAQLIVHDPGFWLSYLIEKYTKVICRTDYMSGDVTFIIFK